MDAVWSEWLNLVIRWAHVITGIAWIGSSFFFMWLDARLEKPETPEKGVEGELWLTHSGGFYRMVKLDLAPDEVPKTLHWFKWEAGFSWITGILLLILVYYMQAEVFLLDPAVSSIGAGWAVALGVGLLIVSWLVYDAMYRSPLRHAGVLIEIIGFALLVLLAWGLTQVYSGRGAYMHVGAIMGTIMVANVWMIIIPGQRKLVEATRAGTALDPQLAFNAKQRSVHNNYMTLPLLFIMLSSHYPSTFGHGYNWAVLMVLFVVGAVVRHWFNLRNDGTTSYWPIPTAIVAMLALIYATLPPTPTGATAEGEAVSFAQAYEVIAARCVPCHAAKPADENFDKPPKNVAFDTPGQIRRQAAKIRAVAVMTRTMPLGNTTRMTERERGVLGRWIAAGAEVE